MPKPPKASRASGAGLESYESYRLYRSGVRPSGAKQAQRWPGVQPWEIVNGKFDIPPGEVFCRAGVSPGKLCSNSSHWPVSGNLRGHVKRKHHSVAAVSALPRGRLRTEDALRFSRVYARLMDDAARPDALLSEIKHQETEVKIEVKGTPEASDDESESDDEMEEDDIKNESTATIVWTDENSFDPPFPPRNAWTPAPTPPTESRRLLNIRSSKRFARKIVDPYPSDDEEEVCPAPKKTDRAEKPEVPSSGAQRNSRFRLIAQPRATSPLRRESDQEEKEDEGPTIHVRG